MVYNPPSGGLADVQKVNRGSVDLGIDERFAIRKIVLVTNNDQLYKSKHVILLVIIQS
jgi:hypothetical protein